MKPETEQEKKWFFLGYFYAQAEDLADELGISKDEAASVLSEGLKNVSGKLNEMRINK